MNLDDLQTPTLLIHLDRVRHNIGVMRQWLRGDMDRWRPHVKTCKIPEVLALFLAAKVRRFKCATTRELEVLLKVATASIDDSDDPNGIDVLFAMAQHGTNLDRLSALAAAHPRHRISVLSEDPDHAALLRERGFGVFVDLDPGFLRTGIPLAETERIAAVVTQAGANLRGLHCYDGHLHDPDPETRQPAAHAVYKEFVALAHELSITGELVTSGTPTFGIAIEYPGFRGLHHTVSPGTVVYWDARSEQLGIPGFAFAAEIHARVISRPTDDCFTVDAGSKALDAAAGSPCAMLIGPCEAEAGTPSEEHLPFRVTQGTAPPVGTLVRLIPRHVCPTVNLADQAVLFDGGEILGIVDVAARGHETLVIAHSKPQ